ncbi:MAG TPA: hypothetical protein HPP94_08625 [Desulfuromonadales bacterium]|nr:hypothetical protein [Desulfuromonadales bacterium]
MLKEMKSHCHLKPGQKGTKRLVEQYGESLLCVRYRYDETRGVRLKTVEIIVEEKTWQPPFSFKDGDIVPITVAFEETELRAKLQKMRARWDPNLKIWLLPYRLIRGTELETRIPAEYLNGSKQL